MKAKTRLFGEIEIEDDKIITLEKGMIGFPDMNHFALIHDKEKEKSTIMWLQSMDDPETAFPVMDPHRVKADYNPSVNEKILSSLGELKPENTFVLNTITVPRKVEDFTMNLKAPIIINTDNNRAAQIIVEDDYPVKFRLYEILHDKKEKAGE
jgi:flagellar assembly factor FliW